MVNSFKKFVCSLFFIFFSLALFSQNINQNANQAENQINQTENESALQMNNISSSYVTENEKGEQIITQKLVWEKDDYVSHYIFILEKKNNKGVYVQTINQKTTENFIELTLQPGFYRYKLQVYNFLGKLDDEGFWQEFEIIRAIQPRISSVSPKQVYLDEENDGLYTINGRNFDENTRIEFFTNNHKANAIITQVKNNEIVYQVNLNRIDTGKYTLRVTNRGGLYAEEENIAINFKKLMDFDLFTGYVLPVIPYDNTLKSYFNSTVFPLSVSFGFSFMPYKRGFGYFGLGLFTTYSRFFVNKDDYKISSNFLTTYLNFIFQKPLIRGKLVLDVHAGSGLAILNNCVFEFSKEVKSPPLNSFALSFDIGTGLQVYYTKRFYTEFRANVSYSIFKDVNVLSINPCVLCGWQF